MQLKPSDLLALGGFILGGLIAMKKPRKFIGWFIIIVSVIYLFSAVLSSENKPKPEGNPVNSATASGNGSTAQAAGRDIVNNFINNKSFSPAQTVSVISNASPVYIQQVINPNIYIEPTTNVLLVEQYVESESNRAIMAEKIQFLIKRAGGLEQQIINDAVSAAGQDFNSHNYSDALEQYLKAVRTFESNSTELNKNGVDLTLQSKGAIYSAISHSKGPRISIQACQMMLRLGM